MNIQTILGLTATAPKSTLRSIADHLGVDGESGVIRGVLLPLNLHLTGKSSLINASIYEI